MMINNPKRNIRLIDLLDMYSDDLFSFDYNKIYDVVGEWLKSEKEFFINPSQYDEFIKAFCDRYFRRNLNFNTFLDFKIAFRNTLKKYRGYAEKYYKASLIDINPLNTYDNVVNTTSKDTTQNSGKSNNWGHSDSTNDGTNNTSGYDLHSDTPQNVIDVKNMFDKNTYITDANNNKVDNTIHNTNNSSFNNYVDSINEVNSDRIYEQLSKGYNGNQTELLEKYISLNTDIIAKYLEWIEVECLFSNVLY